MTTNDNDTLHQTFHFYTGQHAAVNRQLRRMSDLMDELGADAVCARHSHVSKSLTLPVALYDWTRWGDAGKLTLMMRDNFHDVNLYVRAGSPVDLPLDTFYECHDFAWYQGEVERCRGYAYRDWSEEEVDDPRILRVRRKNGNGWNEVKADSKDRWAARMTSTDWYRRDWSSAKLLTVGPIPFNESTTFYRADHAFAEGIPDRAEPYTGPCTEFILCFDEWADATRVAKVIAEYVKSNHGGGKP